MVQLIQPRDADDRFPELPIYERDPTQVCGTCRCLVRLRQHDGDTQGQIVCREGPPNVTSVVDSAGRVGGVSQSFVPPSPRYWCMRWQPRTNA
jgi:hypothetical protein